MTHQQRRLRRERNTDNAIYFSEKTCDNRKIKIEHYGTIQDLYDYEFMMEEQNEED